jgi:hypothetical protein
MDEHSFKKLLNEALAPIKIDLANVKDTVADLKDTVADLKDTVENRVLPSVIETEATIKAYGDMYKINNSNDKKLQKRVEVLEENAGIDSPPELHLAEVR